MYYSMSFSVIKPIQPLYFDADNRLYGTSFAGANSRNTWVDWHLIPLQRPSIAPPDKKTKTIDVPGMNGDLDVSESLTGYPVFANRKGSIDYMIMTGYEEWSDIYANMVSFLHGRKLYMAFEDDPGYYYYGTFTIGNYDSQKDNSNITINYDLEPYRMEYELGYDNFDIFDFNTDHRSGLAYNPIYNKEIYSNTNWIDILVNEDFGNYTEKPIMPIFKVESRPDTSPENTDVLLQFINKELGINIERRFQGIGEFYDPRIIFTQIKNHGKVTNMIYPNIGFEKMHISWLDMYPNTKGDVLAIRAKGNCLLSIIAPAGRM